MKPAADRNPTLARLQRQSLIVGVLGAIACAAGAAWDLNQFYRSYLAGYSFWMGIAVGCLALAMLHQLVHGTWGLATSRLFEAGASTLPLVAVLFVPIIFGIEQLYPWAGLPPDEFGAQVRHKLSYLNRPAFLYRTLGYFAVWIVLQLVLNRWSLKRDRAPADRLTQNIRRVSAIGLILFGLTVTFAAIDWLMSLEPRWYSTIYGGLFAMGAILSAFAFVIAVLSRLAPDSPLAEVASPRVFNDLGGLLMAWVILWTYLAFSQYLITWSGNGVEEISWYLRRTEHGWEWLALAIGVFQFFVPFLLLLSRDVKGNARPLARVACGLLIIGYVNALWMVAPAFDHSEPGFTPATSWTFHLPHLHWLDFATPVAIGGIWMAAFFWRAGRHSLVAFNDPAWENLAPGKREESHGGT